jgi:hypothetical protein
VRVYDYIIKRSERALHAIQNNQVDSEVHSDRQSVSAEGNSIMIVSALSSGLWPIEHRLVNSFFPHARPITEREK